MKADQGGHTICMQKVYQNYGKLKDAIEKLIKLWGV